jgi:hypothetical protein
MKEALSSSETSALKIATWRNISEDAILLCSLGLECRALGEGKGLFKKRPNMDWKHLHKNLSEHETRISNFFSLLLNEAFSTDTDNAK